MKDAVPLISNAMLVGDKAKFLAMLLTLKVTGNGGKNLWNGFSSSEEDHCYTLQWILGAGSVVAKFQTVVTVQKNEHCNSRVFCCSGQFFLSVPRRAERNRSKRPKNETKKQFCFSYLVLVSPGAGWTVTSSLVWRESSVQHQVTCLALSCSAM